MKSILITAGLDIDLFERLGKRSAKPLVGDGKLLFKPLKDGIYPINQAAAYQREAHDFAISLAEREPIELLLLMVDHDNDSTQKFALEFFPFALVKMVPPLSRADIRNGNEFNRIANRYLDSLQRYAVEIRRTAAAVREVTTLHNTSPVLLPLRNFRSPRYQDILMRLFFELGSHADPRALLRDTTAEILAAHPRKKRDAERKSVFSDGHLYFSSPGKARHAFFRYTRGGDHVPGCLLNARTRLGGSYDPSFHYDCTAVRGRLGSSFPDCHSIARQPASTNYVNIAPNDFVR